MATGSGSKPSQPPRTFPKVAIVAKKAAPASTIHPSLVHLRCRVSSATATAATAMLPITRTLLSDIAAPERPTAGSHGIATNAQTRSTIHT